MDEQELRKLIADVKRGTLPRRRFMQMVAVYGLTAPLAAQLLALSGVAYAQPASTPISVKVPLRLFRYIALGFESFATYTSTQPSLSKSSVATPSP